MVEVIGKGALGMRKIGLSPTSEKPQHRVIEDS